MGADPPVLESLLLAARASSTVDAWARALRLLRNFVQISAADWRSLTESDLVRFLRFAVERGYAASTIHRLWGDLRSALQLFDLTLPSSRVLELSRQGLAASRAVPLPAPPAAAISTLLAAWQRMPSSSPVQRRDRALVLCALLLGARPSDLLAMGREPPFLVFSADGVRLRFFRDKGSRLAARATSRVLCLLDSDLIDVSATLRAALADVPRTQVVARVDASAVFAPFFVRLDVKGFGQRLDVDTVSRILSRFLASAGLAGPQARAREIRAYAASAAYELGAEERELCLHFRWQQVSTFLRHYYLRGVERRLEDPPSGPRDGSRVSLLFAAALRRHLG